MEMELNFLILVCVRGMANDLIELRRETRQVAAETRALLEDYKALHDEVLVSQQEFRDARQELKAALHILCYGNKSGQVHEELGHLSAIPSSRVAPTTELAHTITPPIPISKGTEVRVVPPQNRPSMDPPNKWIKISAQIRPGISQPRRKSPPPFGTVAHVRSLIQANRPGTSDHDGGPKSSNLITVSPALNEMLPQPGVSSPTIQSVEPPNLVPLSSPHSSSRQDPIDKTVASVLMKTPEGIGSSVSWSSQLPSDDEDSEEDDLPPKRQRYKR